MSESIPTLKPFGTVLKRLCLTWCSLSDLCSRVRTPFGNLPVVLHCTADWVGKLIGHMEENGCATCEPTHEAQALWCKLLKGNESKPMVIPRPPVQFFWFGGVTPHFDILKTKVDNNFPGLKML